MKRIADLNVAHVVERKKRGRKRLAGLSFAEKVQMLEAMRVEADAFRRTREAKSATQIER